MSDIRISFFVLMYRFDSPKFTGYTLDIQIADYSRGIFRCIVY